MENRAKTFLWGAVSVLAALLIGALVSGLAVKAHFKAILDTFKPEVVEVIIHDTLRLEKPVFVASKPIHDSIPVPIHDTTYVVRADTLYLPKEQKEYADEGSDDYDERNDSANARILCRFGFLLLSCLLNGVDRRDVGFLVRC